MSRLGDDCNAGKTNTQIDLLTREAKQNLTYLNRYLIETNVFFRCLQSRK